MAATLTETITGQIAIVAIPRRAENIIGVDSGASTAISITELATSMISAAPVTNVNKQVAGREYRTAHQISAGNGKARLPAPPMMIDAATETINASTGRSCSGRNRIK